MNNFAKLQLRFLVRKFKADELHRLSYANDRESFLEEYSKLLTSSNERHLTKMMYKWRLLREEIFRFCDKTVYFEYCPSEIVEKGIYLKILDNLGVDYEREQLFLKYNPALIKGFKIITNQVVYSFNMREAIDEFTKQAIEGLNLYDGLQFKV